MYNNCYFCGHKDAKNQYRNYLMCDMCFTLQNLAAIDLAESITIVDLGEVESERKENEGTIIQYSNRAKEIRFAEVKAKYWE